MIGYQLPTGSQILVSLFRPVPNVDTIGLAVVDVSEDMGLLAVTAAIIDERDYLIAALPELLPPGPPVSVLFHVMVPGFGITATSCSLCIERAMTKADLSEFIFDGELMKLVAHAIANAKETVDQRAAGRQHAPTTGTVQ